MLARRDSLGTFVEGQEIYADAEKLMAAWAATFGD
jgi:hypothetical protein